MISRNTHLPLLILVISMGALRVDARGAEPAEHSRDLRNVLAQALAQDTDLAVENQPLRAAFHQISEQTGIGIELDAASVELLPYGADTHVSVTIKGYPLGEGLGKLISPIGMTFELRADTVVVKAKPVLRRIGRRATWDELGLIEQLSGKAFPEVIDALAIQFQVPTVEDPRAALLAKAKNVGQGTAADVLDIVTRALGWTWYPQNRQIVVVTREQQAKRRLDTPCTLRYQRRNLGEILAELGALAGLTVTFEPGVLGKLPAETRESFSLLIENVPLRQAFELICGNTGLGYRLEEEQIRITSAGEVGGRGADSPARDDPYVGRVSWKGESGEFQFEFFLRQSDLPPDLKRFRKDKIAEAIEVMRKELAD